LRLGPAEELRWFVAETDALTRLRAETPPMVRERFVEETRRWVMRDLRGHEKKYRREYLTDPTPRPREQHPAPVLTDLIKRFGASSIERWSDSTWESFSLQALWRVCREGVHGIESFLPEPPPLVRHRDVLRAATDADSDRLVHDVLIRFCAAFTDQGLAHWPLPNRERGFYKAFFALYGQPGGPPDRWEHGLAAELARVERAGLDPLASIQESLELLGVAEDEQQDFIIATVLALRGWAGMLWHMEVRPDRVPFPVTPNTLNEYLAVRLILERLALSYLAEETLGYTGPLSNLRSVARATIAKYPAMSVEQRAFLIFQLAQVLGWYPPDLYHLSRQEWSTLIAEIEGFLGIERRRLFHLAFERRFRTQALDALSIYTEHPAERVESPRFQAVFCIDAREESFRRHLEEFAPDTETFGAAGFFSVPIYYRGASDAHFTGLCPIVITPKHWVVEDVVYTFDETHRRRAKTRRALGTAYTRCTSAAATSPAGRCWRRGWEFSRPFPWWPGCCFRA